MKKKKSLKEKKTKYEFTEDIEENSKKEEKTQVVSEKVELTTEKIEIKPEKTEPVIKKLNL